MKAEMTDGARREKSDLTAIFAARALWKKSPLRSHPATGAVRWAEELLFKGADIRSPMRNVEGYSDYAEIVNVADRLSTRGYSERDVHKILGENFLRVFEEVWR